MYEKLTPEWASTLLAFVALAMAPYPCAYPRRLSNVSLTATMQVHLLSGGRATEEKEQVLGQVLREAERIA